VSVLNLEAFLCPSKICAMEIQAYPIVCSRDIDGNIVSAEGSAEIEYDNTDTDLNIAACLSSLTVLQKTALNFTVKLQPEGVTFPELCAGSLEYSIRGRSNVLPYYTLGAHFVQFTVTLGDNLCGLQGIKITGAFCGDMYEYLPVGDTIPLQVCVESTTGEMEYVLIEENEIVHPRYSRFTDPMTGDYVYHINNNGIYKKILAQDCTTQDVIEIESNLTTEEGDQGYPPVVPGEEVAVFIKTLNNNNIYQLVDRDYFHTCCLTGGYIVSIQSSSNPRLTMYTVLIEGKTCSGIYSTDFKEYTIGDWVYVLKISESSAYTCNKEAGCVGDEFSSGIIFPLHITGAAP
jgi:hypothetical protein